MSDVSDANLMEQFARNQSQAAFAELVKRHISLAYSLAFRKTGNPQLAEDITQAMCFTAWART
ncbi:MAG TPA: sigma factor [Verrucomicrobiae bacterium]|nr:sigma factor [Verrucomicrobiae bacterium]